jgi:hypothetical protein
LELAVGDGTQLERVTGEIKEHDEADFRADKLGDQAADGVQLVLEGFVAVTDVVDPPDDFQAVAETADLVLKRGDAVSGHGCIVPRLEHFCQRSRAFHDEASQPTGGCRSVRRV